MASVRLRGLTKAFGQEVQAVSDMNLHIAHGELVSLLGPSGCGKTTTLRLIAGFIQPDSGEVILDDRVIASPSVMVPPERRNMSMIFQSYAIWPHMTVFQNVAYGLKFRSVTRTDADRKVRRILEVVKLGTLSERYPAELSGGQQQRVALARALVVEPQILLLDEPLSNLDANLREEMRFEIRRLHDEFQITSIYVTHDQAEAMVTSDRIVVMNRGRAVQVGTPVEIFEHPESRFVAEFIGKTNILKGRAAGQNKVSLGDGLNLTMADATGIGPTEDHFICIRPHQIKLMADEVEARQLANQGYNLFAGVVQRRIYFGDAVDYSVAIAPHNLALRIVADPTKRYEKGAKIFALIHPAHCVAVRPD
jgi:ABC-type Fe3+/spermidine/putrescine transport system ATPase subunit